jgi:hypothetical protein
MICLHAILAGLVGGSVCSTYKTAYTLIPLHVYKLYHTCMYSLLSEDEPSGYKHVEDTVKIKILVSQNCILLIYVTGYYNTRCKKRKFLTV